MPILAVVSVLVGRFGKNRWEALAAERLRGRLIRREHPLPRWLALGLLLAAISALILAMARPQGDAGVKTQKTEGRNVMIALDLSRSMRVKDVNPDRLGQAKVLVYELLETLDTDRVGLIGFAGTASLYGPLTIDYAAIRETVEQIDEEWVERGGSDISDAIKLATQTLKETGQLNNALVLISDGEELDGDLDAIIADAERSGVTIFAIGVGTEDGGFVPHPDFADGLVDRDGSRVLSRLQPEVMRKLATETGGRYMIAGRGANIPAMIESAIQGMDTFEAEGGQTRVVVEFYQWALLPGILFLMGAVVAGTRWKGIAKRAGATAAGMLLISAPNSRADMLTDARKAFSEERYDDARDAFHELAEEKGSSPKAMRYRLGEGLAAYEAEDFRGARSAYSGALLSEDDEVAAGAHEGLGNTLFQLGWQGLSGSSYPEGDGTPDMEVFEELVRDQLAKMAEAEVPDSGETNEFIRLDAIIMNWADAVRHYDSALGKNPGDRGPERNRTLAINYLIKLKEILEEEKEQAEANMPEEGEGQGGGQGEPGEGEGGGGEGSPGGSGDLGEENEGGGGGDEEEEDGSGKDGDEEEGEGKGGDPNESPEDRARRILGENADVEKGPLTPGGIRRYNPPEKDW
ncbi:MAG: VWA domain-containing protein [Akkermansiaceae bacterium]|nr:VWA domain-containing protein [Akkermansiaceae bacterium]